MNLLSGWWRHFADAWRRARARSAEHDRTWSAARQADRHGLCEFQRIAQHQVDTLLGGRGVVLTWNATPADPPYMSLHGTSIAPALQVWLHDDTTSYTLGGRGDYFEHWDYNSPDALLQRFLRALDQALEQTR